MARCASGEKEVGLSLGLGSCALLSTRETLTARCCRFDYGIPHAVGFSLGGVNGGGINIDFSDGAYYYLVGQEGGSRAGIANLNTAARHLYHRVHG
jgi:hypothetical protein